MREIILLLALVLIVAFGYLMMKKLDAFLDAHNRDKQDPEEAVLHPGDKRSDRC